MTTKEEEKKHETQKKFRLNVNLLAHDYYHHYPSVPSFLPNVMRARKKLNAISLYERVAFSALVCGMRVRVFSRGF